MFWNAVNGVPAGGTAGPPPSQLISRRPDESGPGLFALLGLPRAARKASTEPWIEAAFGPDAENTTGAAAAFPDSTKASVTKADRAAPYETRSMVASSLVKR